MSQLNIKNLLRGCGIFCAIFGFAALVFGKSPIRVEPELFTKCWDYSSMPDLSASPATDSARVYFLNVDDKLEAADLRSATKVWSSELGGDVISNLLVVENALFVVTSAEARAPGESQKATLRSLSKQTGVVNWMASIPAASHIALGLLDGRVVAIDSDGSIAAFDPANGTPAWNRNIGASIVATPHFGAGGLTLATGRNEVMFLSVAGRTSIISKTRYLPTAVLFDPQGRYLIGDERGNLLFTDADGDSLWKFRNGARISFLLPYDSEFVAASFDNFIYKLSRSGNVEWKRRLPGRVASQPLISGNTAVVSVIGDGSVYFIDLRDGKISNKVDIGDENISGMVTAVGRAALILGGSRGLALYSRDKCPAK